MNLANEVDLAMDEAIKRHLGLLLDSYFRSASEGGAKLTQLVSSVKQLERDSETAIKALEDI